MALRYSFDLPEAAGKVEAAISAVLDQGLRTADIAAKGQPAVATGAMGDAIVAELARTV